MELSLHNPPLLILQLLVSNDDDDDDDDYDDDDDDGDGDGAISIKYRLAAVFPQGYLHQPRSVEVR